LLNVWEAITSITKTLSVLGRSKRLVQGGALVKWCVFKSFDVARGKRDAVFPIVWGKQLIRQASPGEFG